MRPHCDGIRLLTVQYRSLQDRSVVITGGASGIGEEIVRAFAAQGARVSFIDIATGAGHALAGETAPLFTPATSRTFLRSVRCWRRIENDQGGVDVLVNNAGKDDRHDMTEVQPDYWRRALAFNLDHQFFATQAVARAWLHEVPDPSSCSARFPGCAAVPAWSGTRPRRPPSMA